MSISILLTTSGWEWLLLTVLVVAVGVFCVFVSYVRQSMLFKSHMPWRLWWTAYLLFEGVTGGSDLETYLGMFAYWCALYIAAAHQPPKDPPGRKRKARAGAAEARFAATSHL